jgi:hypothetical protein
MTANEKMLLQALKDMVFMFGKVSDHMDWRRSYLDAEAVSVMNETLMSARRVIISMEGNE